MNSSGEAMHDANDGTLVMTDADTEIARVETAAVAVLNRSEVEAQLDAAHRNSTSAAIPGNRAGCLFLRCASQRAAPHCIATQLNVDSQLLKGVGCLFKERNYGQKIAFDSGTSSLAVFSAGRCRMC